MPPVNGSAIKDRAARLRAAGAAQVQRHLSQQVGREHAVLMENQHMGRTAQFAEVRFSTPQAEGDIVHTTIRAHDTRQLIA